VTDLLQHIEQNIQNRKLLKCGQAILVARVRRTGFKDAVACSSCAFGAASVGIDRRAFQPPTSAGAAANADEQLVRKTAMALKLSIVVGRANVRKFAKKIRIVHRDGRAKVAS